MQAPTILLVSVLSLYGPLALAQAEDAQHASQVPEDPITTSVPLPDRACRGVHATGETSCWDEEGIPIGCSGTGQDGEYQMGITMWEQGSRFTDNLDGTVTDNLTSLIWLQNANCFGANNWANALSAANTLAAGSCGLTDGSGVGDWRLPNTRELQSLIDYGRYSPALPVGHPFYGVEWDYYWTSGNNAYLPSYGWCVRLGHGYVSSFDKALSRYVWPVRGGQ